ncbi:trans-sulfuration enzyme family protein [Parachitinimonas caeni]|uniref:PLP-dependent aspartate aminotransferase family protein n=1 Tax=Parachitinimonas caeni TaxID=3031301 RepID=A0ABT7DSZ9_9NEIS|nr:PLP-dependent aspartate aminotransferase family protein [Parachitinimonas caeni]MDK2123195.1 PLP-dependent aspartate aminotransferase family protein [Parachitinimonas caeni]
MPQFDTQSVHAGYEPDATGAVMPPIYTSTTFIQSAPGQPGPYEYARSGNPTRQAFERALAELEGGSTGLAFASGLAATATVLELLDAGSHIVAFEDLYGGVWRQFERVRNRSAGLRVSYVPTGDLAALRAAVRPDTKLVWVELPTNPLLEVVDLEAVVQIAHAAGALVVADATFATPYLLKPLDFGVDIVVHSVTKYLNGHSDVIGGAAVVKDAALGQRLAYLQNAIGAVMDPFSSFLALRGLRTLHLRMARHSESALRIADWLQGRAEVSQVIYPGLPSHPQHILACRLFAKGHGGVLSVRLAADAAGVNRFLSRLKLFALAESLGGVESLISQPASMSHGSLTPELRAERGLGPELLRLSVGVEDAGDLIEDLAYALDGLGR